jgi:hypothetical protein
VKSKVITIAAAAGAYSVLLAFAISFVDNLAFSHSSGTAVPPWQVFVSDIVVVLRYPTDWLFDALGLGKSDFTVFGYDFTPYCYVMLNTFFWSLCIGLLIYGFRQFRQRLAA